MFDCGMHMGYQDQRCFPDWAQLVGGRGESITDAIDCVVISHFHLDHCGALPYLTEVLGYDGPVFMTMPTAAIAGLLLKDYVHIITARQRECDLNFYAAADVDACLRRVIPVALGETVWVNEHLRLETHYAGHVLGAVMISVQCLGQRVLYTGDFNLTADRHLGAARIGRLRPDVVITESTYATSARESNRGREAELLRLVHKTVEAGGKVLIPSFAVGRAQVR